MTHWRIKKWRVTGHCSNCGHTINKDYECRKEELGHKIWWIDRCLKCRQIDFHYNIEELKEETP